MSPNAACTDNAYQFDWEARFRDADAAMAARASPAQPQLQPLPLPVVPHSEDEYPPPSTSLYEYSSLWPMPPRPTTTVTPPSYSNATAMSLAPSSAPHFSLADDDDIDDIYDDDNDDNDEDDPSTEYDEELKYVEYQYSRPAVVPDDDCEYDSDNENYDYDGNDDHRQNSSQPCLVFGFARRKYDYDGMADWARGGSNEFSPALTEAHALPPEMIRAGIGSDDETMSSSKDASDASDASTQSYSVSSPEEQKGVSFSPRVRVRPIPQSSDLTPPQRQAAYTSRTELRANKLRNKREYSFDGCDWRYATEEDAMAVCPWSGEAVHPAHL